MFRLWVSWYSNRPAWTHGFNAKMGFEKYAPSPEISAKMCQILLVWFGRPIFNTFLVISWDPMQICQNRFLRWNREFEPVNLNTRNPIIWATFFTYKGVRSILSAFAMYLNMHQSFSNLCIVFVLSKGNNFYPSNLFWEKFDFWTHLGCFKEISWLKGCFRRIWRKFRVVLRAFHGCFKKVSRVFQKFFKGVSRLFQECFKGDSRVFQECFKSI